MIRKTPFTQITQLSLLGALTLAGNMDAKIIADFEADFSVTQLAPGWTYKWNPTGVKIGDHANYMDLVAYDAPYEANCRYVVDLENQPSPKNTLPNAQWLKIAKGFITPGDPILKSTDGLDHYAIACYTIQEGEAGIGSIQNSKIARKFKDGSGKISIFINGNELGSDEAVGDEASTFNVPLGELKVGDTIYLAFGPSGNKASGAKIQFQIDTQ
ncbi:MULTISPECIES: hypothetical protein [unclassified Lentimonas]|uniref:hypothetical protein n=1 Tax=unclassified Lentimonas TaxID=2630993 RepID=UPI001327DBDC|nr:MULTISPECIES: hypothetical protein [unclassified Lentimonas]CAA6679654.1 Unannotated [Lentimonas sp. CC4]CAA6683579.1 Unannotated [Lentimonas sp. CC6]CAA7077341.1 Unannotated [Lentimonas sp. CC4]CAA7170142.1 Unannotated [Lentimonas sp. CC21]CAA7182469.1 Unannotated [Lentimonas sp. CC8]